MLSAFSAWHKIEKSEIIQIDKNEHIRQNNA